MKAFLLEYVVAIAFAARGPSLLPPELANLPSPPSDATQLQQALQLEKELGRLDLMGGLTQDKAATAYMNLYGNWTATNFHITNKYLNGLRIQIVNKEIFFRPEPKELRDLAVENPKVFAEQFAVPAAHALVFLSRTVKQYPVPDVDFTISIGDFCLGTVRGVHEGWGLSNDPDANKPQKADPPQMTEAFQAPIFSWNTATGGRKTCNAVSMPTYDWNWWTSNFTAGSWWRLDKFPQPPWEVRQPKLIWRGSLVGEDGIRARALRLGRIHPDLLDIKATNGGIACDKFSAETKQFKDHNGLADCLAASGPFLPMEQQLAFRYILEMDGGSSTWRFKNSLLGGFLVFKVDSGNTQFFFSSLQPFEHYVPVDAENFEEDLVKKIKWANEHPTDAKSIAAAGAQFAKEHLRDEDAHWAQQAALGLYAGKQHFKVAKDGPSMKRFCCQDATNVQFPTGQKLTWLVNDCVSTDPSCAQRPPMMDLYTDPPKILAAPRQQVTLAASPQGAAAASGLPAFKAPTPQETMKVYAELNEVLKPYPVGEGFVTQEPVEVQTYHGLAAQPWVKTICEIGFNAGHSSILFLMSNPQAMLVSFDLGRWPYTKPAVEFVERKFPGRFIMVVGDSTETVPAFASQHPEIQCDLLVVDGGHEPNVALADVTNMARMANPDRNVLVVDDTPCAVTWCVGPGEAWDTAVAHGSVVPLRRVPMDEYRGFSVGEFKKQGSVVNAVAKPALLSVNSHIRR
jgi:hypothetical protein